MREAAMPTGFATHRFRRPLALLAAWLVALQALLAGIAAGQAGAIAIADPIETAAICHGAGDTAAPGTQAPDTGKPWHLCCDYCTSAAPGLAPPIAAGVDRLEARPAGELLPCPGFIIVRLPGAVRAGPSQAPPVQA